MPARPAQRRVTLVLVLALRLATRLDAADCALSQEAAPPPGQQVLPAMAYDSMRRATVLFGGYDGATRQNSETWEWNGSDWTLRSTTGPQPRFQTAISYDSARQVTVLFGGSGQGGTPLGDTWEWDGSSWTQRSAPGPAPRRYHAMSYDSSRGVTVLFGGYVFVGQGNVIYSDETWEWDGMFWVLRNVPGPPGRYHHALAFDAARGVTVLFGGDDHYSSSIPLLADTWEWDGTSWILRATSGPSARVAHSMVYDTVRGVTVLYGGWVEPGDTWEWDGVAWTLRDSVGPPIEGPRYHGMSFDQERGVAVLVITNGWWWSFSQTWGWDGLAWVRLRRECEEWTEVSSAAPLARSGSALAFDRARSVAVLFGGWNETALGDTWEWDGGTWSFRADLGPSPRERHAMAFDSARGVTVLFGGSEADGSGACLGDTWEWDGSSWTLVSESGPVPRAEHALAFDAARRVTVLFGGRYYDGASQTTIHLSDTWEWNGFAWTLRTAAGPSARAQHGLAYDPHRRVTLLFGGSAGPCGWDSCQFFDDTWEWNGTSWRFLCEDGPSAIADHGMAYDEQRHVITIFGGLANGEPSAGTWEWTGVGWISRRLHSPPARSGHSMVYDAVRQSMLMFGGFADAEVLGDTWQDSCWCAQPVAPAAAEPSDLCRFPQECFPTKNRYLSFAPPPVPCGATQLAIRVTLGPLAGPSNCPNIPDFSAFNGSQMWVGPEFLQDSSKPTGIHRLQSTPHFDDWTSSTGIVDVSDCNIVPCATYTIEAISDVDYPNGPYSAPLVLSTTPVWGDIVGNGGTPANGVVDAIDVVAMVTRFKNLPGAPPRTWCDVHGNNPTQGVNLDIDALDITLVVDAFKGFDYPFAGPSAPAACP